MWDSTGTPRDPPLPGPPARARGRAGGRAGGCAGGPPAGPPSGPGGTGGYPGNPQNPFVCKRENAKIGKKWQKSKISQKIAFFGDFWGVRKMAIFCTFLRKKKIDFLRFFTPPFAPEMPFSPPKGGGKWALFGNFGIFS